MPDFELKIEDATVDLHDPAGPEIQTHEVNDEFIVTFGPAWAEKTGWKAGDTLVWSINDPDKGGLSIINKSAELRQKVDALLAAGPEL